MAFQYKKYLQRLQNSSLNIQHSIEGDSLVFCQKYNIFSKQCVMQYLQRMK
ncbi:unnamed protein product [Paramecium octaurelia]|uniref:Uncharacterized protein n=1 Tax=Paramecium octaurelia TaxID=43137 RepID=A0A8S1T814_PAROT|nr:unnamed protein product [Paramecium octaurelia]